MRWCLLTEITITVSDGCKIQIQIQIQNSESNLLWVCSAVSSCSCFVLLGALNCFPHDRPMDRFGRNKKRDIARFVVCCLLLVGSFVKDWIRTIRVGGNCRIDTVFSNKMGRRMRRGETFRCTWMRHDSTCFQKKENREWKKKMLSRFYNVEKRKTGDEEEKLAKQQEDRQAQGHRKQKKKKRAVASIPLWTRVIASDVTLVARSLVVSFSCCSLYTYSMSNVWRTSKSRRKIDKTRGKKRKKKTSSESSRYKWPSPYLFSLSLLSIVLTSFHPSVLLFSLFCSFIRSIQYLSRHALVCCVRCCTVSARRNLLFVALFERANGQINISGISNYCLTDHQQPHLERARWNINRFGLRVKRRHKLIIKRRISY